MAEPTDCRPSGEFDGVIQAVMDLIVSSTASPSERFEIAFAVLLECVRVRPESRESVLEGMAVALRVFWASCDAADDDKSVN